MNIYQGNTYRKDLSWLHFNDESRVQERQQVKDQLSYKSVAVGYLKFQVAYRSTSLDMTTVFHASPYGRFIEVQSNPWRKKRHRINQGSNFLGSSFSNTDNVRAATQFRRERKPSILNNDFSSRTDPFIVTLITPLLLHWLIETRWVFPALKSTSHFLSQFTASRGSDSSSEANSSCWNRSDA